MEKTTAVVSNAEEAIKSCTNTSEWIFTDVVSINSISDRESFVRRLSKEISPAFNVSSAASAA